MKLRRPQPKSENTESTSYNHHNHRLEGARESAYLRQENFYRRPLFENFVRDPVRTVLINMRVKFIVRSFNHFGAISI